MVQKNLLKNRHRITDVGNNLMIPRGQRCVCVCGGGINWEIGTNIYTLLYIKYKSFYI